MSGTSALPEIGTRSRAVVDAALPQRVVSSIFEPLARRSCGCFGHRGSTITNERGDAPSPMVPCSSRTVTCRVLAKSASVSWRRRTRRLAAIDWLRRTLPAGDTAERWCHRRVDIAPPDSGNGISRFGGKIHGRYRRFDRPHASIIRGEGVDRSFSLRTPFA